jgi:hypothetical protein
MACCDRHQWYRVAEIDGWMVHSGGNDLDPVLTWAQEGGIWRPDQCELTREDVTGRVRAAGPGGGTSVRASVMPN